MDIIRSVVFGGGLTSFLLFVLLIFPVAVDLDAPHPKESKPIKLNA